MSTIRQNMIDLMTFRNFSPRTHEAYFGAVFRLAKYYDRSPEKITEEEVKQWLMQLFLKDHLAPATVHQAANGVKFLYHQVLGWEDFLVKISLPSRPQKIPALLTRQEVQDIIQLTQNLKHYTMLSLCYGCGLRVSEVVAVQVSALDSRNLRLKVVQGKGKKDRMVPLPKSILDILHQYWRYYRSPDYLFYGPKVGKPLSDKTLQKIYHSAKDRAGVKKPGGIHGLRHAFATHQLDAGMPIHQLKEILGHTDIRTTMRYLHWCPQTSAKDFDLLEHWNKREAEGDSSCMPVH